MPKLKTAAKLQKNLYTCKFCFFFKQKYARFAPYKNSKKLREDTILLNRFAISDSGINTSY